VTDEELIARYKLELSSEAQLARGDLDEIEDHLRMLASELRDAGMPRVEATVEACRRLGDPRAVAREHARVRSPFGARLSNLRTASAFALIAPIWIESAIRIFPNAGVLSHIGIQLVLGAIITVALGLRLHWARPIVIGGIACFAIQVAVNYFMFHGNAVWMVLYAGIVALVVPWRRHELTASGWALALNVWAFAAAAYALEFGFNGRFVATSAQFALVASIVATAGIVLRARWAAAMAAISAILLVSSMLQLMPMDVHFPFPTLTQVTILGVVMSGAIASAVGAMLSRREARSTFGTLRYVLR
jgi:hypothetical protein